MPQAAIGDSAVRGALRPDAARDAVYPVPGAP